MSVKETAYAQAKTGLSMQELLKLVGKGATPDPCESTGQGAATAASTAPPRKRCRGDGIEVIEEKQMRDPLDGNVGSKRKKGATTAPHKEAAAPKGGSGRLQAQPKLAPEAPTPEENAGRGRKPKPLTKVCEEHMRDFNVGNESSLHFGGEMEVVLRSLRRYITIAQKLLPPPGTLTEETEEIVETRLQAKQLQMIESCMIMWRAWNAKAKTAVTRAQFQSSWQQLMRFLTSSPAIHLECKVMWEAYYNALATGSAVAVGELSRTHLSQQHIFACGTLDVDLWQHDFVRATCSNFILRTKHTDVSSLASGLAEVIDPLLPPEMSKEFPQKVCEEMALVHAFVLPSTQRAPQREDDVAAGLLRQAIPLAEAVKHTLLPEHQDQHPLFVALMSTCFGVDLLAGATAGLARLTEGQRRREENQQHMSSLQGFWQQCLEGLQKSDQPHLLKFAATFPEQDEVPRLCGLDKWVASLTDDDEDIDAQEARKYLKQSVGAVTVLFLQPWAVYAQAALAAAPSSGSAEHLEAAKESLRPSCLLSLGKLTVVPDCGAAGRALMLMGAWVEMEAYLVAILGGTMQWPAEGEAADLALQVGRLHGFHVLCECVRMFDLDYKWWRPEIDNVADTFSVKIEPALRLQTDSFTKASRERVEGVYEAAVQLASGSFGEACVESALQVDVNGDLDKLVTYALNANEQRLHTVRKACVRLVQASIEAHANLEPDVTNVALVLRLTAERQATESLHAALSEEALKAMAPQVNEHLPLFLSHASKTVKHVLTSWTASLEEHVVALRGALPAKCVLEDRAVLSNVELQKKILENPRREEVVPGLSALTKQLEAVKMAYKSAVLQFPDELRRTYKDGLGVKQHAKMYCCVDYVLDRVLNQAPSDHQALPGFAKDLQGALAAKGIEPPLFIQELLIKMANPAPGG